MAEIARESIKFVFRRMPLRVVNLWMHRIQHRNGHDTYPHSWQVTLEDAFLAV